MLTFLFIAFSISLFAQSKNYAGEYVANFNVNNQGQIEYTLQLKPDGTFTFHNYRKISTKKPEENQYGQGTWNVEKKNVLYFYTDKTTEIDKKYVLNFTNTKARYVTKSPRDKSDKIIKTHLRFYQSDIPWVKGWTLYKK